MTKANHLTRLLLCRRGLRLVGNALVPLAAPNTACTRHLRPAARVEYQFQRWVFGAAAATDNLYNLIDEFDVWFRPFARAEIRHLDKVPGALARLGRPLWPG